ncbi:MAG: FHA domain-containing protein [Deltaproteobacteria bacterium]|nr:MAG: FHA domain-containing protein [Deltaproteobacteria bacterium]
MFCPSCGFRNPEGERFCRSCGAAMPSPPSPGTTRLSGVEQAEETASDPCAGASPGFVTGEQPAAPRSGSMHDSGSRPGLDKGRRRIADMEGSLRAMLGEDTTDRAREVRGSVVSSAPLRPGTVKLVVEQGKLLGEQYLLNDDTLLIGRFDATSGVCPDIDLTAQDPAYVHRRHARLQFDREDRSLHLIDLGGRNGSFVNNTAVPRGAAMRLRVGDKVRIGRVVMRLRAAPEMDDRDH